MMYGPIIADISTWGPWEYGGAAVAIVAIADSLYSRFQKWLASRDKGRDEAKQVKDAWPRLEKKLDEQTTVIKADIQGINGKVDGLATWSIEHTAEDRQNFDEQRRSSSEHKAWLDRLETWIKMHGGNHFPPGVETEQH